MRRLAYASFLVAVVFGLHCAITDYPLMTDEYTGEIINTNGKALIATNLFWVTEWPDGKDNPFTMVDQKANGDRVLTTYNFYSTDTDPLFDFTYCSPDWQGCALFTAPDPQEGDVDPFDGAANESCLGWRSLVSFSPATYRYGECGRTTMTVEERMKLYGAGEPVPGGGLAYRLHGGNAQLFFDNNAGVRSLIPLIGDVRAEVDVRGRGRMRMKFDNPLLAHTFRAAADWRERYETGRTTISLSFNGVEKSLDVRLRPGALRTAAERL